jgi:hypothetical protein
MKKFILFFAIILLSNNAFSAQANPTLDKIENAVYGFTYSSDTEQNRINRLEETIYGQKSSGQLQTRIAKLKKDLSADQIGQEITPCEDTFMTPEDSWVAEKEPEEAQKMDYPVIDELEKQVFQKEFKDQNIKTRLSNLETKTFGKSYANEDLSTRVDRLKAKIQPQSFLENKMAKQENTFFDEDIDKMAQDYHLNSYGDPFDYDLYNTFSQRQQQKSYDDYSDFQNVFKPSKTLNISTIEKTLYKTKYENEPMDKRLSRIETSIFGSVFASDTESERIARISSAINAQKTARRYDSNRFGQNMATAFQIGTLILMVLACIL